MIPDKIYIQSRAIDYWLPRQNIVYTKRLSDTSIEYIRKDALLEWAKEMKNINLKEADEKNDTFSYGIATGFAAMIDKLNLM